MTGCLGPTAVCFEVKSLIRDHWAFQWTGLHCSLSNFLVIPSSETYLLIRPSTGTRLGALVNQHSNIAATPVIIRRGRTQGRGPAPGGSGTAGRRPPRPSTPPPQPVRSSPPTVALAGGRPIVQPQFRQPAPWRPAPQQPTLQQPAVLRPAPLRPAPLRPATLRPASLRPIPLRRTWAPRRDWNRRPVVNNFRRQWRRRRW